MQIKHFAITALAASMSTAVSAQEAGSIDLGGFDLIPAIEITAEKDDNVTRTNVDKIDSWKTIVAPELILLNNFGANQLQFGYRLERGDYSSSEEDNYTDHFLSALLDYEMNSRHRAKLSASYEDGHDERGTSYSIGRGEGLTSVDTYKAIQAEGTYSYGALTSDGRVEFDLGYLSLDYDGEEEAFLVRDRNLFSVGGRFLYKVGALTDFVVEVTQTDIAYDFTVDGADTLDSVNRSILAGVQWETTAATSSFVKVGYQEKEFDSASRSKFSGFDWSAGVIWQPVDRTTITLTTKNDTDETNGEGNFINRKSYSAVWQHDWLERLSTRVQYALFNDVYEGSTTNREDDLTLARFSLDYEFRRWLSFELYYQYDERESLSSSTVTDFDYDRNIYGLTARFTL